MRRGKVAQPPLQPSNVAKTGVFRVSQDRDGAIWFTSRLGVYRVNGNQLESPAPGLGTRAFYLDRDGDLWIGTNGYGLVHFRRRIVRMFTTADGLPVDSVMAILPSHDGKLWLGGNCGFSEYDGEHFRIYQEKDGLLNTCVWSLAEDPNHDLWIGTYGGGMFRMHDGQFTQYSKEQGLADRIVLQIAVAQDGSLWVATQEGLSHMQSGHFRNYTTADGLASNLILGVHQDRAGTVWAATQAGVNRLVGDRFVPFPSSPSEGEAFAIRFAEDTRGDLFTLESPRGLSLVANDRLVKVPEDFKFLGMVESPEHDLWFSGKNGITRVRRDDLINAAWSQQGPLDYQTFNRSDGLASIQCSNGRPNIALTADRKLWVATVKGLATINLAQIPRDATPPKLFVGSITVGREKVQAGEDLTLPPGTHHLELHLEAVDLSSPEKVRIQYRMDDVDPLWLDADMSHTAVYSNLPPGKHALHVRASASNGVWDRGGIVFDVTQEPYFYQTTWFRLLTAAIFILLASTVYLLRVRQILRLAKVRMAERIEERTRIARDLHDTLLQSFQAVLLRLQSVRNVLPDRPGEAAQRLDSAMDQTAQAIAEGRDAVRELRSSTAVGNDLAQAIGKLGEEFRANESNRSSAAFVMQVEGAPRDLSPILRDEVYRIAGEAMRNAFRHADAHRIEVEIRYDDRQFRLRVRDDGKGIDPHLLAQSEPAGHYGLHGMRERATLVGGHLDVWSKLTSGTEVELTIPALIAYVPNPDHQHSGPSSAETDS